MPRTKILAAPLLGPSEFLPTLRLCVSALCRAKSYVYVRVHLKKLAKSYDLAVEGTVFRLLHYMLIFFFKDRAYQIYKQTMWTVYGFSIGMLSLYS